MIVIVDYGLGNLGSIANMLGKLELDCAISDSPGDIGNASHLILSGVGHFDHGMACLSEKKLLPVLHEAVLENRKPVLGICLGAQLLMSASEEGGHEKGLDWIPGRVRKFDGGPEKQGKKLRVPHMGWGAVTAASDTPFFDDMDENRRFYFVHSYYMQPEDRSHILCSATYGDVFTAGIYKDNITGVQFHPEKSHKYGMQFFKNYFLREAV